jgi:hypothetical protein
MEQKLELSRIIFLNLFVKEMILKKYKEYETKHNIDVEKIRKKFIEDNNPQQKVIILPKEIIDLNTEDFEKSIGTKTQTEEIFQSQIQEKRKPTIYRGKIVKRPEMTGFFLKKPKQIVPKKQEIILTKPNINLMEQIKTTSIRKGPAIELINPLLKDNSIIIIECQGPGKNIIVKKYNQINVTRIILNELEIKSIIEYFANEARIPLVGGILKAAVGNSIISAIVSEFVGSRFIINKTTPYSLLNKK